MWQPMKSGDAWDRLWHDKYLMDPRLNSVNFPTPGHGDIFLFIVEVKLEGCRMLGCGSRLRGACQARVVLAGQGYRISLMDAATQLCPR